MNVSPRRLLLLSPELLTADGGIAAYGRTLARGLSQVLPQARITALALLDNPAAEPDAQRRLPGISWEGFGDRPRVLQRLVFALAAARELLCGRVDLLIATHAHFAPLAVLLGRLTRTPVWISAHGIEVWHLERPWRRLALAGADRLLPVSRFTAECLGHQLGVHCPPLALLPNSYDHGVFTPGPRPPALLARYGLSAEQPLIFCLTRLSAREPYKNVQGLIEAMPTLLERWPDLRLLIGGEGDDRPRLMALVEALDLQGCVLFAGRLADGELPDHYRLATVFALPSSGEGFGIVFLEALGCGRPVLAGNRDGSVDPLADGVLGCLVDPQQPLADPLAALLARRGPQLWFEPESLSAAVAERFAFPAFCRRLEDLLADLGVPRLLP